MARLVFRDTSNEGWPTSSEVGNTNSTSEFAIPTAKAMGHPTPRIMCNGTRVASSRRRGLATIEFALVLPLLLMLTLGTMEYGWLFLQAHQITNAAQQGARIGVLPDRTAAEDEQVVATWMNRAGLADSGYTVAVTTRPLAFPEDGLLLTVSVGVPYANIRLTGFPVPLPSTLKASISMAKERG